MTDPGQILEILEDSKVLHLGLVDEGMPYVVPMNYGFTMEDGKLTIYLHCGMQGRKLDIIRKNPMCCVEMECGVAPFEGRVACQYGTVYSSVIGTGKAVIVEDVNEKMKGLSIFMKTQTGKDFQFNEKLVSIVNVIRVDVEEYAAKHRPAPERDVTKPVDRH